MKILWKFCENINRFSQIKILLILFKCEIRTFEKRFLWLRIYINKFNFIFYSLKAIFSLIK